MTIQRRQELIWKFDGVIKRVLEEKEYIRDIKSNDGEKSDIDTEIEKFLAIESIEFDTEDSKEEFILDLSGLTIEVFNEIAQYVVKQTKEYIIVYYFKKDLDFKTPEALENYFNLDEKGRKQTIYFEREFDEFKTRIC